MYDQKIYITKIILTTNVYKYFFTTYIHRVTEYGNLS